MFAALLLFALFARIVVPTGFMPVAAPGGVTITICTDMGLVEASVDASGKLDLSGKSGTGQTADSPCAFAGGLSAALLADAAPAAAVAVLLWTTALPVPAVLHLTPNRLAAPPPPSQGPPNLI